jgi:hypothetical protein
VERQGFYHSGAHPDGLDDEAPIYVQTVAESRGLVFPILSVVHVLSPLFLDSTCFEGQSNTFIHSSLMRQLVAGCVMEGASMMFHGDYKKRCLLTIMVSQILVLIKLISEIKYSPHQKDFSLHYVMKYVTDCNV